MEPARNDASSLLDGISQDVERQIKEIEEEAVSYSRSRRESTQTQAKEILRAAEEAVQAQSALILKNAESKAGIERRKMALKVHDRIIQETLDQARRACADKTAGSGYSEVLKDWIVEAAIGLSVEAATVNASKKELPLITDALLRKAEAEILKFTGKPVRLGKIENDPLPAQGIVLTAEGGRLAYNNQVPTRFLRSQTDIRKRIYSVLFNEGM